MKCDHFWNGKVFVFLFYGVIEKVKWNSYYKVFCVGFGIK